MAEGTEPVLGGMLAGWGAGQRGRSSSAVAYHLMGTAMEPPVPRVPTAQASPQGSQGRWR